MLAYENKQDNIKPRPNFAAASAFAEGDRIRGRDRYWEDGSISDSQKSSANLTPAWTIAIDKLNAKQRHQIDINLAHAFSFGFQIISLPFKCC
jgi:hypothetical protein